MKIGDYVRTKTGINKITNIKDGETQKTISFNVITIPEHKEYCLDNSSTAYESEIIKSSPNIIDLIEVGDYVNGFPVLHKENNELVCGLLLRYKEENIQNVVIKECFESMSYKVGK